jgi:branched-chain amino acid transport system ATP-binding protein
MLRTEGLTVSYGGVVALHGCSVELGPGGFLAVLGANGAGKTSLLHTIARLTRQRSGHVWLNGMRADRWSPDRVVREGISLVPEGRRLFPSMSVKENLDTSALRVPRERAGDEVARALDAFPELRGRLGVAAGRLSGGEQQMLAIARALIGGPRLLLVDELSMGLAPAVIHRIYAVLEEINLQGTTVVVVEQYAELALRVAREALILERGRVVFRGRPAELHRRADLLETAYLGRVDEPVGAHGPVSSTLRSNGHGTDGRHLPAVAEVRLRLEGPVKRRLEEQAHEAGMELEEWLHGVASAATTPVRPEGESR